MNKEEVQEIKDMVEEITDDIFGCSGWLDEMLDKVERLIRETGRL